MTNLLCGLCGDCLVPEVHFVRVVENIGTVARSGTSEFLASLEAATSKEANPELIGQFGVGFYAAFMVADTVDVLTRRAGEAEAWREFWGDVRSLRARVRGED